MARRSDHTREELHDMAIREARVVLAEEGLRGLSTRKVATRMGYSPGTLYNVFADLDDLILNVNAQTLAALGQALSAAVDGVEAEAAPIALARAYVAFVSDRANLWDVLFEHRLPEGREPPGWYSDALGGLLRRVEGVLSPLFPDDPAACEQSVRVLWAGLHGICSLGISGKLGSVTPLSMGVLAESLVTNYLKARRDGRA